MTPITMVGADTAQLRALDAFDRLLDLDAEEREAQIEALAVADPPGAAALVRLFAADRSRDGLGPERYADLLDMADAEDIAADTGRLIGPWRLLEEIGRGGMGTVWLAERADGQYEQRAALKLIKRGMDSDAIQARFLAERRILATLEHPNIARLLDGGIAADGRPYFAMEYVPGSALPDFARSGQLDLRQRLTLFLKLCHAVAYAHSRLVVHRDLKPSNVLVGADGEPKLLDFGIAKLLDDTEVGTTRTGERVFSPAYAAPEQLAGETIGTATDVYALGLILFELLTGDNFASAGRVQARTTERPSQARTRLGSGGPVPIRAAQLRGDLDLIVVKSMAREPTRRYPTAQALADELTRYLDGRPIQARPDSLGYRMRKFARRHATSVAAGLLVLVALSGGLAAALWQAQRAAQASIRAETVKNFLADMFRASDPAQARGKTLSARDLLDQGAKRLQTELSDQPAVKAELQSLIGGVYLKLGEYPKAEPILLQAERTAVSLYGPRSVERARLLTTLSRMRGLQGNYPESLAHARTAEAILRELGSTATIDLAANLTLQSEIYGDVSDHVSGERFAREAVALARASAGEQSQVYRDALGALGLVFHWRDDYAAAERIYQERVDIARRDLGNDHPQTIRALSSLGALQNDMCHYADAEASLREALAGAQRLYGPDHANAQAHELELAFARMMQGHAAEAEGMLRDAREKIKAANGDGHPRVGYASIYLGYALEAQGHLAQAEAAHREAAAIYAASTVKGADYTLRAKGGIAMVLREQGRVAESLALLRESLPQIQRIEGPDGTHVALVNILIARDMALLGQPDQARAIALPAHRLLLSRLGPAHDFVADAERAFAEIDRARGNAEGAAARLQKLLEAAERRLGAADFRTAQLRWQLAQVTADPKARIALESEAAKVLGADPAADHPLAVWARKALLPSTPPGTGKRERGN